jgi:hypothetical protein
MATKKRKTLRKEHGTPKRSRYRALVEAGFSSRDAAARCKVPRGTASKWHSDRHPGGKRTGRRPIIPDSKVEEMIQWMTGHFDRRVMPLQGIAKTHGIKATDDTILAAFGRYGYHHHVPDTRLFLSEATKKKRYTFSITNWDRPKEY